MDGSQVLILKGLVSEGDSEAEEGGDSCRLAPEERQGKRVTTVVLAVAGRDPGSCLYRSATLVYSIYLSICQGIS